MPRRTSTEDPAPPPPPVHPPPGDWRQMTIPLPLGVIVSVVSGALAAFGMGGFLGGPNGNDLEIKVVRAELAEIRADLRVAIHALEEVRRIEEAAHPRWGVPGVAPAQPAPPKEPPP